MTSSIICSTENPHHAKKPMSAFLSKTYEKVSTSHGLYMAIYFLYLLAASTGVPHTFSNRARDPMMQTNQTKILRSYNALQEKVNAIQKTNNPNNLTISKEVQDTFLTGTTQVQKQILNTLDFEFRNANLTYMECCSCMSQTMTPCNEVSPRKQKCTEWSTTDPVKF